MSLPDGVEILGPAEPRFDEILTDEALAFVAGLQREFGGRRAELLEARAERQTRLDEGERPAFLEATRSVRGSAWKVAPAPPDLRDRRVEITGPTDRKMVINALNSGARCFMADLEDSNAPTWSNMVGGQVNLADAVRRTIELSGPDGREYRLVDRPATLLVRPRGWHLPERHLLVDGSPVSGSLFDFGLAFVHNAREQLESGTGPYFYLPKLEGHLEARLWNDVFVWAQERLAVPARHDPRDRADRDDPGSVRDGRDPVRAPRALGRSERRTLGLHLQRDQEVPAPARISSCLIAPGSR